MSTLRKAPKAKTNFKRFSWRLIRFGLMALIWSTTLVGLLILWFSQDLPDVTQLAGTERRPSITIQTEDGDIIGTYGDLYNDVVKVEDLPSYVSQALMAVEDRRFFYHFGIDFVGLIRAAWTNYRAHRVVQGGSTLTQQLAKNLLFSKGHFDVHDRSIKRKIQEVILALWLERKFTKNQILTLYINRVYLGSGTYGIDAAAHRYFHKSAKQLTVFEAAVIAGLLKAPSKYSPASNPQKAIERAKTVLQLMQEAGFITSVESYWKQGSEELNILHDDPQSQPRYFTDWIYEQLPALVGALHTDIIVTTTLQMPTQKHAEQACQSQWDEMGKELKVSEFGLLAMSPDGAVRAMVGGRNYAQSQFNRTTQALRQPGSSFKMFIFLTAMENGYTPDTMIDDSPITVGNWSPSNFKWRTRGSITLRTAFAHSVNSVPIRLALDVGIKPIQQAAKRLGITGKINDDISLALGTCESTLLEMTTAFATFANQGFAVWPYGIARITTKSGEVIYEHQPSEPQQIVNETALAYMRDMMHETILSGTGRASNVNNAVYGKTGSNQDRDAWFFGFREGLDLPSLAVGVWVGNDDNKPMAKRSTGGRLPARIAGAFFKNNSQKGLGSKAQKSALVEKNKSQSSDQVQLNEMLKGF